MSRVFWLDIPSSLDAPPREERGWGAYAQMGEGGCRLGIGEENVGSREGRGDGGWRMGV